MYNVAVIGMGYVGLTTALSLDRLGCQVYYYDLDETKMEKIKRKELYIFEHYLEVDIKGHTMIPFNLKEDFPDDIKFVFICVGTPSQRNGLPDTDAVFDVMRDLSRYLSDEVFLGIVLKSTVPPGTSRKCIDILEETLNKKLDETAIKFYFNPEFLREGQAVTDTLHPDKVVIGSDSFTTNHLGVFYKEIFDYQNNVFVLTNYENAELIKYVNNAFLATKISFINNIAQLCEKIPKADVGVIADAIGMDKRIGRDFLNAGIGFGGSCFPKDVLALVTIMAQKDVNYSLMRNILQINDEQKHWATNIAEKVLGNLTNKKITILGMSFKPDTDDTREAPSKVIMSDLSEFYVHWYDPVVKRGTFEKEENIIECIRDADCVIVCTEWEEFRLITPEMFKSLMRTPIVIDGRRIYDPVAMKKAGIRYYGVGYGRIE